MNKRGFWHSFRKASPISYENISPSPPTSATSGVLLVAVLKAALPSPPAPPLAAMNMQPSSASSATTSPSMFLKMVPSGTGMILCSAFLPSQCQDPPSTPFGAFSTLLRCSREEKDPSERNMT